MEPIEIFAYLALYAFIGLFASFVICDRCMAYEKFVGKELSRPFWLTFIIIVWILCFAFGIGVDAVIGIHFWEYIT